MNERITSHALANADGITFAKETVPHHLGELLPISSILPFLGMLLSIAIIPLLKPTWWEHHMTKIVFFWSVIFLIPFGIAFGSNTLIFYMLETVLLDYLPFIILLFGLYTVAGGIVLKGTLVGTPKVNVVLLLIGTVLASWIGTTGASMLLIRPVIRANQWRHKKTHIIIFFIFLVSNIGGCLTPLGDPPLFLGFVRGVPFFWTMNLLPLLLLNTVVLLVLFFGMDTHYYKKELSSPKESVEDSQTPLTIEGLPNLFLVLLIIFAVFLNGLLPNFEMFAHPVTGELYGLTIVESLVLGYANILPMSMILIAAFVSLGITKKSIRLDNGFTWAPIQEVAVLFIGIFITMIPALALLRTYGTSLGLSSPAEYFWATGLLSSFLDNAPTYLVFMTTAGAAGAIDGLHTAAGTIATDILLAISAGAVFMGAVTYIGNAPNFMVRSIAEESKIPMPSFFGYMLWSICILVPVFLLDTVIFFR